MKVKEVIANDKKTSKAGKPYWSSKVILDTQDEPVFAFGYARVGAEVTHEKKEFNGKEYDNYKIVQPDRHEEVMNALRAQYKLSQAILKAITGESSGEEAKDTSLKDKWAETRREEPKKDTVYDVPDGEEVSLKDIPF